MNRGAAFRGQPLLVLVVLLAGWLTMRAVLWQPPFQYGPQPPLAVPPLAPRILAPAPALDETVAPALPEGSAVGPVAPSVPTPLEPRVEPPLGPIPAPAAFDGAGPVAAGERPITQGTPRGAIGHNLLLMAGLSQMERPPALVAYVQSAPGPVPGVPGAAPLLAAAPPRAEAPAAPRWSADAWLLVRNDTTSPLLSGRPSYGRSQAGGVVRYRLDAASPLRPQAYVRASSALGGAREQEIAAGVSARPLAGLPIRIAAEARASETARGTRVRPAAFAVTEFPPLALPLGMRAEAYAQVGYVGGEYATAFADGQARIERPVARLGQTELSAGAGVWGGAQRDAARLDIGPTAAISFPLGNTRGRVAADYRFRVAGAAEPSSGPALTLSAGF